MGYVRGMNDGNKCPCGKPALFDRPHCSDACLLQEQEILSILRGRDAVAPADPTAPAVSPQTLRVMTRSTLEQVIPRLERSGADGEAVAMLKGLLRLADRVRV